MDNNIKKNSQDLAIKTVRLHKQLTAIKKETVMSAELIRCGAGVGAELIKSEYAMGKNDKLSKVYKALQNCIEARYWLELLNKTDYITEFEFNDTYKLTDELGKQIIAMVKTMSVKQV